ncbi:MAG: aspartate kinase, partial [Sphaerochaeta sp.]
MVVCKFGGSSVADALQLRKIKAIIDADPKRSIIIVSAPGKRTSADEKVTDLLYECANRVTHGESCSPTFAKIIERYSTILDDLQINHASFDPLFRSIEARINEGSGSHYAASRGEFLAAKLVAAYFGWEFLDTQELITIQSDGTVSEGSYERITQA